MNPSLGIGVGGKLRSMGDSAFRVALEGMRLNRPRMLDWSVSVIESFVPDCDPQMNSRQLDGIKYPIRGRMRGRQMHTMPRLLSTLIQMSSGITDPIHAVSFWSKRLRV